MSIITLPLPVAFMGSGPGFPELLLIFGAILVLFGPAQLPKLARALGTILSELRSASQDFRDQIMSIDNDDKTEPSEDLFGKNSPYEQELRPDNAGRTPSQDEKPASELENESHGSTADRKKLNDDLSG